VGTPEDNLSWAHPVVREWFLSRFGTPTEPQIAGWQPILARRDTLISAPTGSGKTLAAFLACIDLLVRQSLTGGLSERTQVLYISPLKALGNDVQKNLDQPLFEIQQLAAQRGYLMPAIRTMVRTGDTPPRDRARMLKLPPHILVTTPESLYILLTAARSRETLRHIHTVIVDEIHALAGNKRGAHLALSLERLDAITHQRPNRIGLSATQRPLSLIAEFLSGQSPEMKYSEPETMCHPEPSCPPETGCHPETRCHPERSEGPLYRSDLTQSSKLLNQQSIFPSAAEPSTHAAGKRPGGPHPPAYGECGDDARAAGECRNHAPVTVVIPSTRPLDLAIELPSSELGPIASNEMWDEIYQRLEQLTLEHRSTLVFVNTRRLVERISHRLSERMGEQHVAAHHGSLSRHLRLESERRLKQGECRILIATASLELGIDIGNVDLVCQIGSPRSISIALQRVGRAGHWRGAIPKGRFFATTRDELVECAAIIRAIRQQDLDRLTLPDAPLDILAQQIVAACAADEWNEDELFALVRRARNYRDLSRESFDKVLVMLSDGISAKRGRFGAYLYRDQVNHRLRARRGSRLAAITSGGAIPETALLSVVALPEEIVIGTLDEDFAIESNAGDIMLLGNTSWRIRRVEARSGRVLVEDAHGQPPTIPFWRGEAPARTFELSTQVADLRQILSDQAPAAGSAALPDQAHAANDAGGPNPPALGECGNGKVWLGKSADQSCHPERSEGPLQSSHLPHPSELSNQQSIFTTSTHVDLTEDRVPHLRVALFDAKVGSNTLPTQPIDFAGSDLTFLDPESHRQLTAYIREGRTVLGAVPTQRTVIAERFFDEGGGMQLVIHAPFGARINRAWGLALRKRFCRSFNFELQASATDDGICIALAEQHSFPLADVFHFLQPETVAEILQQAVLTGSPIFATRFRWDANRSLALLRFQNGKKVPPQIQRMRSDDLLAAVFPDVAACFENIQGDIQIPDHPLVEEVMKDVMHEAMDIDGLRRVLESIRDGSIQTVAVDTPVPSQFAHEILNANPYAFLDDAPLEERRARAVQLRRTLPASVLEESGQLDTAAIAQVIEESRPDLRDPDDLHDLLQTLILFPVEKEAGSPNLRVAHIRPLLANVGMEAGGPHPPVVRECGDGRDTLLVRWMRHLVETRRAVFASIGDREFWVASEKTKDFASIYVDVSFSPDPPELLSPTLVPEAVLDRTILGWMQHTGPLTTQELNNLFAVDQNANPPESPATIDSQVTTPPEASTHKVNRCSISIASLDASLLRLEATGAILRGHFRSPFGVIEWCDRRLLARIHRLTVATLRKQIEPVTAAQFMHWLLRWQHLAPGTNLHGEHGLLEVLRQLQGFEIPASAWERHILSRRIAGYDGAALDRLCLMGVAGWGRLSPHPATLDNTTGRTSPAPSGAWVGADLPISRRTRRIVPTSVAPITFFLREECEWMQPRAHEDAPEPGLSTSAQLVLDALRRRGASFFADLLRLTALNRLEVERGLWELVAAGFVTADAFDNLRGLISKARPAAVSPRANRPRHTAGRWSLLWNANDEGREAVRNAAGETSNRANESVPPTPEHVEATCWMLLRRYGIVFREVIARESNLPKWRELQLAFRRLEDRGEVRGGRFVPGFVGEQFALPIAVESLRQVRNLPASNELITISAADPLNLVGIIVPGERIPAIGPRAVSFRAGVYVADTNSLAIAIVPEEDPNASEANREAAV
jgi:ATP-dependent Lhr-like helicase